MQLHGRLEHEEVDVSIGEAAAYGFLAAWVGSASQADESLACYVGVLVSEQAHERVAHLC